MPLAHAPVPLGAITAALLCACASAPNRALALTNTPGGTSAPGSTSEAGGGASAPSAAGSASAPRSSEAHAAPVSTRARRASPEHPLLSELHAPQSISAGRPPKVTLKVQESGVASVLLQVSLASRSSAHDSVLAKLGWAPTDRVLSVTWPASAKLAAGSYVLAVSGHDRHGEALLAGSHSPLALTLVVHPQAPKPAAPAPAAPPSSTPAKPVAGSSAPPSTEAPAAGVPSPAQSAAEGAVFPVAGTHNFGGPENAFGAPRNGYSHQGQDILTAEGTPIVAPYSGTIESTSYQEGGAGYYAVEHTSVGFSFFFAHCMAGSLAVSAGQTVAAGTQLCRAGQTGDATTPHLDFEIWIDGWRTASGYPINPLPYLEAWEADGAVS